MPKLPVFNKSYVLSNKECFPYSIGKKYFNLNPWSKVLGKIWDEEKWLHIEMIDIGNVNRLNKFIFFAFMSKNRGAWEEKI